MTTDDLRKLALAADRDRLERPTTRNQSYTDYIAACSPERILALLDVVDEAKAMRHESYGREHEDTKAFDAAVAKLEVARNV